MYKALLSAGIIYLFGFILVIYNCISDHSFPELGMMVIFTPLFYLFYKSIKKIINKRFPNFKPIRFNSKMNLATKIILSVGIPLMSFIVLAVIFCDYEISDNLFQFLLYFYFLGIFIILRAIWRMPEIDTKNKSRCSKQQNCNSKISG